MIEWLKYAGYTPFLQEFDFHTFREASAPVLRQLEPESIAYPPDVPQGVITLYYSGAGDITAVVQPVDLVVPIDPGNPPNASSSGCEPDDFAGFVPGNIALMQRGTSYSAEKVANAVAAGASGVIIMNEGQPDRMDAILSTVRNPDCKIPAVYVHYDIGAGIYQSVQEGHAVRVRLKVDAVLETVRTWNIIADTIEGDPSRTVMVGAHLDSVAAGPGINDNGSGVAAVLEVACKMGLKRIKPVYKKIFFDYRLQLRIMPDGKTMITSTDIHP